MRALVRLERAAHLGRHLSITDDQAGSAWIKGRCSSEDSALIMSTLAPLAAPSPTEPSPDHDTPNHDIRDHGSRLLDALVDACVSS